MPGAGGETLVNTEQRDITPTQFTRGRSSIFLNQSYYSTKQIKWPYILQVALIEKKQDLTDSHSKRKIHRTSYNR